VSAYQPHALTERLAGFMLCYVSWRRFGFGVFKALRAAWRVSGSTR